MRHPVRKTVAVLLALLMLLSLSGVAAFAKSGKTVKTYKTYTSFGDSVAAAVSTSAYKKAHATKEAKTNYFIRVPGSYVDRVGKAVNAKKVYPLAQPGMRTTELRMLLSNTFRGDAHEEYVAKALVGYTNPGKKYEGDDPIGEYLKLRKQYQKAVKEADLITLGLGFNDVWFALLAAVTEYSEYGFVSDMPELSLFKEADKLGSLGAALKQAEDLLNTLLKLGPLAPGIIEAGFEAKARYFVNYRAIVEQIYSLNPDVTLVAVGYFEALIPQSFDPTNIRDYLAIFQPSFEAMNLYTSIRPTPYGKYIYVDTHGTETILGSSDTWDPHPTMKGHKYMAQKIIEALPKQ